MQKVKNIDRINNKIKNIITENKKASLEKMLHIEIYKQK